MFAPIVRRPRLRRGVAHTPLTGPSELWERLADNRVVASARIALIGELEREALAETLLAGAGRQRIAAMRALAGGQREPFDIDVLHAALVATAPGAKRSYTIEVLGGLVRDTATLVSLVERTGAMARAGTAGWFEIGVGILAHTQADWEVARRSPAAVGWDVIVGDEGPALLERSGMLTCFGPDVLALARSDAKDSIETLQAVVERTARTWNGWQGERRELARALLVEEHVGISARVSALSDDQLRIAIGLLRDGTEAYRCVELAHLVADTVPAA